MEIVNKVKTQMIIGHSIWSGSTQSATCKHNDFRYGTEKKLNFGNLTCDQY